MRYDRELLVETLVAHQRYDVGGCVSPVEKD